MKLFLVLTKLAACASQPAAYSPRVEVKTSDRIYECILKAETDFDKIGCNL